MKLVLSALFFATSLAAFTQGHDVRPADSMKAVAFLKGDWVGKQDFNTGGAPMVGDATNNIEEAIGGRYLEERLSTTLPGRKPSDTRHFLTFDPKAGLYRAWWFNDSSAGAMELEGTLSGKKLTLTSKPTMTGNGQSSVMRAIYDGSASSKLVFTLELKNGESWQLLFTTTYSKKR